MHSIHEKGSPKLRFLLYKIETDITLHDFRLEGKPSLLYCRGDVRKYTVEDVVNDRATYTNSVIYYH